MLFVFTGCNKQEEKYTLTQDGNFLVYNTKEELIEDTSFPIGTQLIVKVREDIIEEGYMIDKVIINSVSHEPTFQYHITVDKNIDLKVTFIQIPSGEYRISIIGYPLEIEPYSPDNVYPKDTEITLKAPKYYKFDYLYINDEKVVINGLTHNLIVDKATKIVVEKESLIKTHVKVEIVSPDDRIVTISNPTEDGYYEIGQDIAIKAPQNYHFSGRIVFNGKYINISGNIVNLKVEPTMSLYFYESNIILNSFEITLMNENLEIVGDPNQTLYAHGSSVIIKSISDNGLDIIDTLIVNGKEINVNGAIYEYTDIRNDLIISATFKKYPGPYEQIPITTTEFYPITTKDVVLSSGLNVNMFLRDINNVPNLIFQKASSIKTRIDNGTTIKYVEFIVKYYVEDVKIYRNGFGFINRHEVIHVGNLNRFSVQLEFTALVPNLENVTEFITKSFTEISDHVGNLTYSLELNGLDVTGVYLFTKNGLQFSPEAIGKEFNLIIQSDDGITIIQPIKVIEGLNVYSEEGLTFESTMILQNNLVLTNPITIDKSSTVYGNYHSIIFDTDSVNLITVNKTKLILDSVMLKSRQLNTAMIKSDNSNIIVDNIVLENTKFGMHLVNTDLTSLNSKYQNILISNIILVNDNNVIPAVTLNSLINGNVFQKTNSSSILVVDLYIKPEPVNGIEPPERRQTINLSNNSFNNVKVYEQLIPEIEKRLQYLESIDPSLVNRTAQQYNFIVMLDGGEIYQDYFPLLEITINPNPQCGIIK